MIFFEGGGICLGPTKDLILLACYDRSYTSLGSSKYWKKTKKGVGMYSDDSKKNINVICNK